MPLNPLYYASGIARGIGFQHIGAYIHRLNSEESILNKHFCVPTEQVSQISSFLYNCPPFSLLLFLLQFICIQLDRKAKIFETLKLFHIGIIDIKSIFC